MYAREHDDIVRDRPRPLTTQRRNFVDGNVTIFLDPQSCKGADSIIRDSCRQTLGVTAVVGHFERGDLVRLLDAEGQLLGQGLVNYASAEAEQLIGVGSSAIEAKLGYRNEDELVHRDNLVLL